MRKLDNNLYNVGVNDSKIKLFEGQFKVENGMAYNSYLIDDEKITILDTVDQNFVNNWLKNIEEVINTKIPSYLIISHMEPDHSAGIKAFVEKYPTTTIVTNTKALQMVGQFFPKLKLTNILVVKENDELSLGKHKLTFIMAPMVHWPEVMLTYDITTKTLFSADAFGKFGVNDSSEDYLDEARRYYFGIVGKFATPVQNLLKKASALKIDKIASLHGPYLDNNINNYLSLYDKWSKYDPEVEGVLLCYSSVYGNTAKAIDIIREKLELRKIPYQVVDLNTTDITYAISYAFKYNKMILASITYNGGIFPSMLEFINNLTSRNYQKRQIALIENGSWAPLANKVMQELLSKESSLTICENKVSIKSAMTDENINEIDALISELLGK